MAGHVNFASGNALLNGNRLTEPSKDNTKVFH
jgi:hypothetical protein